MGHNAVNSKILKNYGDMTDGGRTYDKASSSKNKMSLKHLLKITKHVIQEHKLHDEAAFALFRKALTGKALETSILRLRHVISAFFPLITNAQQSSRQ